jgi:hypothetical protein
MSKRYNELKARSQSAAKSESKVFATIVWNPRSALSSASRYPQACSLSNMIF